MDGASRFRCPDEVMQRKVKDEIVLLDLGSEAYFGLNPVGAVIFQSVVAGADVDGAVQAVLDVFDASEDEIRADVVELLTTLTEKNLLELVAD